MRHMREGGCTLNDEMQFMRTGKTGRGWGEDQSVIDVIDNLSIQVDQRPDLQIAENMRDIHLCGYTTRCNWRSRSR